MLTQEYDIFISYSRKDEAWVGELIRRIEKGLRHPLSGKKLRIFRDKENLRAGINWKYQLQQAL